MSVNGLISKFTSLVIEYLPNYDNSGQDYAILTQLKINSATRN
jgi:hypothetical protein